MGQTLLALSYGAASSLTYPPAWTRPSRSPARCP